MEKLQRLSLSFKKGMTNTPSDLVCSDDELSLADGMAYDEGEWHPVQLPKQKNSIQSTEKLLYFHDHAGYEHLIYLSGSALKWKDYDGNGSGNLDTSVSGDVLGICSIGNTVILSTTDEITYYLWKGNAYIKLGHKLPDIVVNDIKMTIPSGLSFADTGYYISPNSRINGDDFGECIGNRDTHGGYDPYIIEEKRSQFNDLVIGNFSKITNEVKEKGLFMHPFWVRFCYKLYDSTNTMTTNPILMLPSVRKNETFISEVGGDSQTLYWQYTPHCSRLRFNISNTIGNWGDIIKGVDVYISDGVRGFELEGKWDVDFRDVQLLSDTWDGITVSPSISTNPPQYKYQSGTYSNRGQGALLAPVPESLSDNEIIHRLTDASQFYRVCELVPSDLGHDLYLDEKMRVKTLLNLTTQHVLDHDGYFDHCGLSAKTMFSYNGRLHLGNIDRGFFEGFKTFMPSTDSDYTTKEIWVKIGSNVGDVWQKVDNLSLSEQSGYWFYYPDPRAKSVIYVLQGSGNPFTIAFPLKEHPWLNGAYFFGALPSSNDRNTDGSEMGVSYENLVDLPIGDKEHLANQLMVSSADNPFLFTSDGFEEIGTGDIVGMVPNVDALSEGQFGSFPLFVFTSEGIWALSVSKEGTYSTKTPMSREVCNNINSITQTDNAVYFTSDKGLMMIRGRNVVCVSQVLNGKHNNNLVDYFKKYLKDCGIAYDYRKSHLWIYHVGKNYVYIYSMKSNTWSVKTSYTVITDVNHYPDSLLELSDGKIVSFKAIDEVNTDPNAYSGQLISRPIKMSDILSLKQIRRMEHHFLQGTHSDGLRYTIKGSDNAKDWVELLGLRGEPWRYIRITINLTNMKATDVYSGLTIFYTTKRGYLVGDSYKDDETIIGENPIVEPAPPASNE